MRSMIMAVPVFLLAATVLPACSGTTAGPGPRADNVLVGAPPARAQVLQARAGNRAFEGAPPVIPHQVEDRADDDCMGCHEDAEEVDGKLAPVMAHPRQELCTQCHVTAAPAAGGAAPAAPENLFVGLAAPGPGPRAFLEAPPLIPHDTWMRQRCDACHGAPAPAGLRTGHPERVLCRQCHVTPGMTR